MKPVCRRGNLCRIGGIAIVVLSISLCALAKNKKADPDKVRNEYIARVQQQTVAPQQLPQTGSLWTAGAALDDLSADYKARRLNDTVIIQVVQQTSAESSGNLSSDRSFSTQSGITGLAGHLSTGGVNPIVNASSATKLKGTGQSTTDSKLSTSLTGQVISVLPNGNLVVEAQRKIIMNNQHETMIVRGVLRPGDISPQNVAASTSLMNLEIELKGKGVVSDSTRPPNPVVRALLRIIGF